MYIGRKTDSKCGKILTIRRSERGVELTELFSEISCKFEVFQNKMFNNLSLCSRQGFTHRHQVLHKDNDSSHVQCFWCHQHYISSKSFSHLNHCIRLLSPSSLYRWSNRGTGRRNVFTPPTSQLAGFRAGNWAVGGDWGRLQGPHSLLLCGELKPQGCSQTAWVHVSHSACCWLGDHGQGTSLSCLKRIFSNEGYNSVYLIGLFLCSRRKSKLRGHRSARCIINIISCRAFWNPGPIRWLLLNSTNRVGGWEQWEKNVLLQKWSQV